MIALVVLLGCGRPGVPDALVESLSGYHEVPSVDVLTARYPGLVGHLRTLAADAETSPHVRTRAWVLLAATHEGIADAVEMVLDAEQPPAVRYKVLRQLGDSRPDIAALLLPDVWCDPARVVRAGARRIAQTVSPGAPEPVCE